MFMFIWELIKLKIPQPVAKEWKRKTIFFFKHPGQLPVSQSLRERFVKELLEYKGKLISIHLSWSYFFETVLSFILWVSDPSLLNVKMSANEKHCNSFVW